MSRKATITLALLVILMLAIVTANAAPRILNAFNNLGVGNNGNSLSFDLPPIPPAIGWLKNSDSILVTYAPSDLSWANVDKKESHCTLATGTISAGDYVTNCEGPVVLVWTPSNSVLFNGNFKTTADPQDPNEYPENPEKPVETPTIKITKPLEKSFYFRNNAIKSSQTTRILGYVDIEATIENPTDTKIIGVRFYIDDELKHTDDTEPYSWRWNEKVVGERTIKVAAYSETDEKIASKEITVSVLNLKVK